MKYYSTESPDKFINLQQAVERSTAPDGGLYMPASLPIFPKAFFRNIANMSLQEIAWVIARGVYGDDIPSDVLQRIVFDTLNFDIPLEWIHDNIFSLELFHGPTMAFKDIGARFMARILSYYNRSLGDSKSLNVIVATSGDTGGAVANGFFDVPGVNVFVLYPQGKISRIQSAQFATLGHNVTAVEIMGNYDDCQAFVRKAFLDERLNDKLRITSANSINIARLIPQVFYYFHAYAQLAKRGQTSDGIVIGVPAGNLGNLCAGLIAKRMGLPIKRFVAACNANDGFTHFLNTGKLNNHPTIPTLAPAMDVIAPDNITRVTDIYGNNLEALRRDVAAFSCSDNEIAETIRTVDADYTYLLDPHSACAYNALQRSLQPVECGVFLATAHPAKFKGIVEDAIGRKIALPDQLERFMHSKKHSVKLPSVYSSFHDFLISSQTD